MDRLLRSRKSPGLARSVDMRPSNYQETQAEEADHLPGQARWRPPERKHYLVFAGRKTQLNQAVFSRNLGGYLCISDSCLPAGKEGDRDFDAAFLLPNSQEREAARVAPDQVNRGFSGKHPDCFPPAGNRKGSLQPAGFVLASGGDSNSSGRNLIRRPGQRVDLMVLRGGEVSEVGENQQGERD